MAQASREFQIFVKPVGSICNLHCRYCYYLEKEHFYPRGESFRMADDLLEEYIVQHIKAFPGPVIRFSWHGGEPTVPGLDYFRAIVEIQRRHCPSNRRIENGMQTNGTLLDDDWCRFLASEGFFVGLSLDGPRDLHDLFRRDKKGEPTYDETMRGYGLLRRHGIDCDILCVVNAWNVRYPLPVYRFFKEIGASYVNFLPLVERDPDGEGGVSDISVPAAAFGDFLCTIFDEWQAQDIGRIKVNIFEEATRVAFGQEHSLCIFRPVCGDIPVIEHNGDFFSCDHFVDHDHHLGNITETPLAELLESPAQRSFGRAKGDALPRYCRTCEVRAMCNGECPKNRFIETPDGEAGLNYLCAGYRRFFTHCLPFVRAVADEWRRQQGEAGRQTTGVPTARKTVKVGRNDPCPCGSGLKYKKCCMNK